MVVSCSFTFGEANYNSLPCRSKTNHERSTGLSDKIVYGHIAGHFDEAPDLKVDTHGADVIEPVWDLLKHAYETHGVFPTLLERDFNIPAMEVLVKEVQRIKAIQAQSIANHQTVFAGQSA